MIHRSGHGPDHWQGIHQRSRRSQRIRWTPLADFHAPPGLARCKAHSLGNRLWSCGLRASTVPCMASLARPALWRQDVCTFQEQRHARPRHGVSQEPSIQNTDDSLPANTCRHTCMQHVVTHSLPALVATKLSHNYKVPRHQFCGLASTAARTTG